MPFSLGEFQKISIVSIIGIYQCQFLSFGKCFKVVPEETRIYGNCAKAANYLK
jgi:hypothetical protein